MTDREVHITTGSTSGIGRGIAEALAESGRDVLALGRNRSVLDSIADAHPDRIRTYPIDLLNDDEIRRFAQSVERRPVASIVHCAGTHHAAQFLGTNLDALDDMFRVNLRAVYQLTQLLRANLTAARATIVCINSSAAIDPKRDASSFSAIQHGLRAAVATLRQEINDSGVRVASIYPGRTNTPRIEALFDQEGASFNPEKLLQPSDIADVVLTLLDLPARVEITDVHIRPSEKSY